MNFHRQGSGDPLVLIHGVGHHWQGWRPVIERLADRFEVFALDTPGFGRSEPLPQSTAQTIPNYAEAIAGWIAERGLDRPHVAGNSMGGAIGLELARQGAARTVTAISPAGFGSPLERRVATAELSLLAFTPERVKPWAWRFAGTRPGGVVLLGVVFSKAWRTPPEERRAVLADAWAAPSMGDALTMLGEYAFPGDEGLPDIPLTVAWGSRDFLLPYALQAPRARRALARAAHVTLKGAGHTPFYDDPDATANVIAATAGRIESGASRSTTTSSSAPARQAVPSRRG